MKGYGDIMDEKQMNSLLNTAAAKLGISPEQLKKTATSGDMNGILSHMDKSSADKVRSALNDKKITDNLMNSFMKDKK
jgi:hypothetical protein